MTEVKNTLDEMGEVVVTDTKDGEEPDCAFKRTKIIFAYFVYWRGRFPNF